VIVSRHRWCSAARQGGLCVGTCKTQIPSEGWPSAILRSISTLARVLVGKSICLLGHTPDDPGMAVPGDVVLLTDVWLSTVAVCNS
jgi:hypothetical protein